MHRCHQCHFRALRHRSLQRGGAVCGHVSHQTVGEFGAHAALHVLRHFLACRFHRLDCRLLVRRTHQANRCFDGAAVAQINQRTSPRLLFIGPHRNALLKGLERGTGLIGSSFEFLIQAVVVGGIFVAILTMLIEGLGGRVCFGLQAVVFRLLKLAQNATALSLPTKIAVIAGVVFEAAFDPRPTLRRQLVRHILQLGLGERVQQIGVQQVDAIAVFGKQVESGLSASCLVGFHADETCASRRALRPLI